MKIEQKARLVKAVARWMEGECERDEGFEFYIHPDTYERLAELIAIAVDVATKGQVEP